jgi:lipoyl(octanoyl) transferase
MKIREKTWRFLDTGKESALFNMALDEVILRAVSKKESPPTIRLYEWQPEAITLGYAQKTDEVIDYELCVNCGVDVTRRLTGGRAVFHGNEIAYSVTSLVNDRHFGGTISETYSKISAVLCEGINRLGIRAVLSSGTAFKGKPAANKRALPCFLSTSKFEITVDGKKLVGSAQRRFKDTFLQQGSILTGSGYEKIADYMKNCVQANKEKQLFSDFSINLSAILNGSFSDKSLKSYLKDAFQNKLCIELETGYPTDSELEGARRLIMERYGLKGWVLNNER